MALPPQKFRELVFQWLYSLAIGPSDQRGVVSLLMVQMTVSRKYVLQAYDRAAEIGRLFSELDRELAEAMHNHSIEQTQVVEKVILRLALYEILYDDSIPDKVAIAEAIRLCRKFASPESAKFVNAVLDTLYQKRQLAVH